MSTDYLEKKFETELCEHLAANGWLYSVNDIGFDKSRALFEEDIFGWLQDTQPEELAKVVKPGSAQETKQRAQLLDRIRKVLDTPHDAGGGTISVLRNGFSHLNAKFRMCQFRPDSGLNAKTVEAYGKVRVRVMRQVHYTAAHTGSIDLVLFVNGIPVATLELKTDFTQSITDAIRQYQQDRDPRGEPLLTSAVVHFAVSDSDVFMTTRLAGEKTRFLPFNLGDGGGRGNPPNPHGAATSYLWQRILQRDNWLDIIGKFVFVTTETAIDPITGAKSTDTKTMFPRLHQWDGVTKLVDTTQLEGAGNRYLIQHSAGSGKTGSIAWTAHRLSKLHDADDKPVFDSVLVITDRTVLDDQLQRAVRQFEPNAGYIATIDDKAIRDAGETSKSKVLATELLKGTRIIVVTIQTFPYAMAAIRENKGLANKRFAVIADEAHSSQTGQTANRLKAVLTAEEQADIDDGGDIDVEAILAAETAARADSKNISYYAFTATPKAKTLELFGRPDEDGKPVPFHEYTMRQAIEEGYILDVLRGYQTYDLAFQIAQSTEGKESKLVDQSAATRGLIRWVALHPTNIDQRVEIVVEHFRENVADLLDGYAKAMVVCDSRKAAVRYKLAIDRYIADRGYDIGTLVAFSGTVSDPETPPGEFSESSMNPKAKGRDLAAAFATPEFRIMLVANKFQTGFDQPLLSAMYVFKRLSGVNAVQTLSRLNRTYTTPSGEVKSKTLVLDFVNKADDIQDAFEPYYLGARIERETDPNIVHDIAAKLDQAGIYTSAEIDAAALAWVKSGIKTGHAELQSAVAPAQKRFRDAYEAAVTTDDKAEQDRLDLFRRDLATYVHVYDFMSQVIDYGNPDLEKRSIYYRLLERCIQGDSYKATVDLSDVTLKNVKQIDRGKVDISLSGEDSALSGITGAGSKQSRDPKLVALADVIDKLNELFGDDAFSDEQKANFVQGLLEALLASEQLVEQARVNTKKQFLESPHLADGVLDAVGDNQDAHNKMAEVFYGDGASREEIIRLVGSLVYEWVQGLAAGTSPADGSST